MKAKKSLLVVALTLVLIAVALILPAAASGAKPAEPLDNKPVAWVNAYTNSNHTIVESEGVKVSLSANVKLLGSGELVGNVVYELRFGGALQTFVMHPVKSGWTDFSEDVAQFLMDDGSLLVLTDNGEPSTDDSVFAYQWVNGAWVNPFGGLVTADNVQIHLSK